MATKKTGKAIFIISLLALIPNMCSTLQKISKDKCPITWVENNLTQKESTGKIEYIFCGVKVDINSAVENNEEELETVIKAIIRSRTKAEKIVDELKKMGRINSVYELEEIKGVGRKTVEKLADFFDVGTKMKKTKEDE